MNVRTSGQEDSMSGTPRPWFRKKWLVIFVALIVLLTVIIAIPKSLSRSDWPSYWAVVDDVKLEKEFSSSKEVSKAICSDLRKKIQVISEIKNTQIEKKISYLKKLAAGSARKAQSALDSSKWMTTNNSQELATTIDPFTNQSLHTYLTPMLTRFARSYKSADGRHIADSDVSAYVDSALMPTGAGLWVKDYCPIDFSANVKFNGNVSTFNSLIDGLQAKAANVPWYPDDYNEWTADADLAWKWDHSASCSFDTASCWHIRVITNEYCGSLYGEINIMSGETIVDYTNDVANNISSGDTVLLEFDTFSDGALTGSLKDLSCY